MAFRLSLEDPKVAKPKPKRSAACRSLPRCRRHRRCRCRRSESAERREKREKQNTCLYVCSIYPPFPIIVSIWETAREIMKQSFVNINSFTSQKKIVIFCFCFTKLEKKQTGSERFLKSLVICNYASKKSYNKSYNYTVSQTEQTENTINASIFCFCLTQLSAVFFFRESVGEKFVQQQPCDIYGFFVFVSLEEELPDRH